MRLLRLHFNIAYFNFEIQEASVSLQTSQVSSEMFAQFSGSVAAEATGRSPVMLQRLEKRICQRMPTLCKRLHALESKAEALVCL